MRFGWAIIRPPVGPFRPACHPPRPSRFPAQDVPKKLRSSPDFGRKLPLVRKMAILPGMALQKIPRVYIIALYVAVLMLSASLGCLVWMSPTGTQQSGDKNQSTTSQP